MLFPHMDDDRTPALFPDWRWGRVTEIYIYIHMKISNWMFWLHGLSAYWWRWCFQDTAPNLDKIEQKQAEEKRLWLDELSE